MNLPAFCCVSSNSSSRTPQRSSVKRGRETLALQKPVHPARVIRLRPKLKPHLLLVVLRLTNLRHRPPLRSRSRSLPLSSRCNHSLLLDNQARMSRMPILVTHTILSTPKIKVLHLRQLLNRTHQMSKTGSSEPTATERAPVKLQS